VLEDADGGVGARAQLAWDGKDAFGRTVKGPVAATASTGYGFGAVSTSGSGGGHAGVVEYEQPTFGVWPPPGAREYSSTREALFFLKHTSLSLGDWVPRENLGNFSLDVLHGFSEDGTLHLGDGSEVSAFEGGPLLRYVAGGGSDFSEDAGSDAVNVGPAPVLAVGPQGTYFIEKEARVRLLRPDAGVITIAGYINMGFAGDGLPATQGKFNYARIIEADTAGNLFIGDIENHRIRRIDAESGLLSTVVGNGMQGYSPDGTLATAAKLDGLSDILVGHDGHLYFMAADDAYGATLRRVEASGVLTTVAGGSTASRPPWEANTPRGVFFRGGAHWLAQDVEGRIYVAGYDSGDGASDYVVRRIEVDGRVRLIAGAGTSTAPEEPLALKTCFSGMSGLAVSMDGTVYVAESGTTGCGLRGPGVRSISPDGDLSLFLGGVRPSTAGLQPPDGAVAATQLSGVGDIALKPGGSLLLVHRGPTTTLHEISLPAASAARLVPSRDGDEVYVFDARGRHLRTVSARTGLLLYQFAWGPSGLASVTDVNGDVTTVERNPDGTVRALVAQDGQRTELTLDAHGRITRVTDAEQRFVEAAYFPTGLLSEWKDANHHATALTWDEKGNLVTHTNARGAKKAYEAVADGVRYTSPEGRVSSFFTFPGPDAVALQNQAPDGTVSTQAYGSGLRNSVSPDGTTVKVQMQAGPATRFSRAVDVPGVASVRTPSGLELLFSSARVTTTIPGDALAVVSETEVSTINGRAWTARYDAAARTYTWSSPAGRVSSMTVDAKQRPLTASAPGVLPVNYVWDSRGRLESVTQGARFQRFTYGPNGFLASTRNALDEVTTFTTDTTGRAVKTKRPDSQDVSLEEDAVGNLRSVTPPGGQPHRFEYTSANDIASYTPPTLPGVVPESVSFDLDGLTTGGTHSDASATTLTREPLTGRLTRVATPWWTSDMTYQPVTGQVQSLTRGTQRLDWKYDGFLVTEEKVTGVAPATSQWTYDSDFRVAQHTVGGAPIFFSYDSDSLLTQAGPTTLTRDSTNGRITAISTGVVVTSLSYNTRGELSLLSTTINGVPAYSEGLGYDVGGRISVIEDTIQGTTTQWTYGYDALRQLTAATRNGTSTTNWSYDARGNRTSAAGVAATYDAQDRLLSRGAVSYASDALGGRLSSTEVGLTTHYKHDGMGALLSVTLPDATSVAYDYDGLQRRVAKRRNGIVLSRFVYDSQWRVAAEVDASGVVVARFVYASESSSPDAMVRSGVTYAYVKDHLGSIRLVVNASNGLVQQRLDYDAWGVVTLNTAPGYQPFSFAGGTVDSDTGLIHFGFRDYDPRSGVWTAMDPIRLRIANGYLSPEPLLQSPAYERHMAQVGMSAPTYAYAANNPIRYTDPSGLKIAWTPGLDLDLDRQVGRLRATPSGEKLWQRLLIRNEVVTLKSMAPYWDNGVFVQGRTTIRPGNDQLCRSTTSRSLEGRSALANGIREFLDPASILGHELTHAESNIYFPGLDADAREKRSRDFQEQLFWELSP
jgi:RHS repeat-associated protein